MGLRVNTNLISMAAQRNLSVITGRLEANYKRLSSGLRISQASDDAAGLGISERMRSQIRSYEQASRNAQDGVSLVESAEGALGEVSSTLVRMRELAIQAANGTFAATDREVIDVEFQALMSEIDRIAEASEFNGIQLLDGTQATIQLHVGLETDSVILVDTMDATVGTLFGAVASSINVTSQAAAVSALDIIDSAITSISTSRGTLGAAQNRLMTTIRSIADMRENLSAAESRIRDIDVASETADLTRNSIMQQAAVSVLSQANTQPQIALSLLQG